MNQHEAPASQPEQNARDRQLWHHFYVRRRSLAEWLMWLIWLVILLILLDYSLVSFIEDEPQAGILSGAIFMGLLLAGMVVEVVKIIDRRSEYYNLPPSREEKSREENEAM